jgi:hypothetical protein
MEVEARIRCHLHRREFHDSFEFCLEQKVEPAKQAKVMQEFQKQSAQINMTVSPYLNF